MNPFHPASKENPLTTPQWVGEKGVDAVIALSIDDFALDKKELFVQPRLRLRASAPVSVKFDLSNVFDKLKSVNDDGAAITIMGEFYNGPKGLLFDFIEQWIQDGASLGAHTHTLIHDPTSGWSNVVNIANCVASLMATESMKYGVMRLPGFDSTSISCEDGFQKYMLRSPASVDSSVLNILKGVTRLGTTFTSDKPDYIVDYPYPYLLKSCLANRLAGVAPFWEIPCTAPTDWQAWHALRETKAFKRVTDAEKDQMLVDDWKNSLDRVVELKGLLNLTFHPHGWISSEQVSQFIDYAVETYGNRVKFLNFEQCASRLDHYEQQSKL